jgi:hypothetical protein
MHSLGSIGIRFVFHYGHQFLNISPVLSSVAAFFCAVDLRITQFIAY